VAFQNPLLRGQFNSYKRKMNQLFDRLINAAKKIQDPSGELLAILADIEIAMNDPHRREIINLARVQCAYDDELEFDDDAIASEGDGNGCFLEAWVWVDFCDSLLLKAPHQ
jgi:hypothetical protein